MGDIVYKHSKIFLPLAALLLGGALSGCASQGIAQNAELAAKPLAKSQSRVKIFRADTTLASAAGARVKVDGREIAEIDNGGSTILDLAAGKHEIVVDNWQHPNVFKLDLVAKPGMMYVLEITPREEAAVAGAMLGLVGMLAEAAANENGGVYSIRVVEEKRIS
ncbi:MULTISPECIES: hypothetical protein [Rhodomicrobium]|uniref:hypothetical protein n=1 Tax=Rhodomicrobium TaxID=1068 RepID=UPI000B4AFF7A|nr:MULTISPECIES: hypothetical protein [Rhodomicrobium]